MGAATLLTQSSRSALFLSANELQQQPNDFLWLFLLYPMPRTINQIGAAPLGAGAGFHSLKCTRGLVDAPITFARNETSRHIDGAAGKRFEVRHG
jgi:hypothetical protein